MVAFVPGTGKFRRLSFSDGRLLEKRIITLFRDSRSRIWIGTQEGVRVYERKGDVLSVCLTLPVGKGLEYTSVNVIHEGTDGIFWIGTRNGVYCFNEQKKELRHLSVNQGLPDNVVHGILEDAEIIYGSVRSAGCHATLRLPASSVILRILTAFKAISLRLMPIAKGKTGRCILEE